MCIRDSSDAVLVVGYDANNVVLYDPAMGQTYKRTTADADEMFFNAGNIFSVSYTHLHHAADRGWKNGDLSADRCDGTAGDYFSV